MRSIELAPLSPEDELQKLLLPSNNVPQGGIQRQSHPAFLSDTGVALLIQQQRKPWWERNPLPGKRDLTFPTSKPRWQAVKEYSSDGTFKGTHHSYVPYSDTVYAHLVSLALRWLNEAQGAVQGHVTLEWMKLSLSLGDRLYEHVWSAGYDCITHDGYERYTGREAQGLLLASQTERLADNAAAFALDAWEPDFTQKRRDWGAKGGKKSKRPPKYDVSVLDGMDHLSTKQISIKLGISTATIDRLKKRKRALDTSIK